MALIICKVCGKSFSDTRDKCVHCGAEIEEKIKSNQNQNSKITDIKIDFNSLEEFNRCKIEEEFLKENKGALKYIQNTTYDKFTSFVSRITLLSIVLYFLMNFVLFTINDVKVYNEKYLIVSTIVLIISFVIMLVVDIVEIIIINLNKNSYRKYIYIKEFQKWLLEKKNIKYIPIFQKDSQKEIFDNVDLKFMKL